MDKPNQRKKKTKTEMLQEIVNGYIAAGEPWPAERRTIAAWAVTKKLYHAQRKSVIDQCAKELAEAMRLEMETDSKGRKVRAKYCAKIIEEDEKGRKVQRTLWFGRDAEPDLMHRSLQQMRDSILDDCKQLKTSQDSYNDENRWGATIQLSFDFEKDLADAEHDTEYNPRPHPEEED